MTIKKILGAGLVSSFEVYEPGHGARIDGQVLEDGSHMPQYKLEVHAVPCEG